MKPILFQREMVRAILDNLKSQTRRVVKPQPINYLFWSEWLRGWIDSQSAHSYSMTKTKCPYGQPGGKLWVKENWCVHVRYDGFRPNVLPEIKYLQNGITCMADVYKGEKSTWMGKTRPSIFMPERFSRLFLEITGIRVERVQDITEEDAIAEGMQFVDFGKNRYGQQLNGWKFSTPETWGDCHGTARWAFANLWNLINAKPKPKKKGGIITHYVSFPWDATDRDPRTEINGVPHFCYPNPWVWAFDFKKC